MEHDDGADHLPPPIVDRGGSVFDGRLVTVSSNEEAVRRQPNTSVELDGLVHRVAHGFARRGVDDLKDVREGPAHRLLP